MAVTYDTTTGLRALTGGNLVSDIDTGFLSLATDVMTKVVNQASSVIATSQTRTNTAFGTLTTADTVTLTVPTTGIVEVFAFADIKESVNDTAEVGLFVDAHEAFGVQNWHTQTSTAAGNFLVLYSWQDGLKPLGDSLGGSGGVTLSALSSGLGCVPLGRITVAVSAGSHTFDLRFKSTSGTVTAQNRTLIARAYA